MLKNLMPLVILFAMAGCVAGTPASNTEIVLDPATSPVSVNPAAAAQILSEMRRARGLSGVVVNETLNSIAQDYADVLAAAGEVRHDFNGDLRSRLSEGGYLFVAAGENLGGGFRSLDDAFERWNASAPHRANLLAESITEIGIATAFNAASPFRTFWVLLVGRPPG